MNNKSLLAGATSTGGYMIAVNPEDQKAPIAVYTWDRTGRVKEITLDHEALQGIAEAFEEYVGKRGNEDGKEERLYS